MNEKKRNQAIEYLNRALSNDILAIYENGSPNKIQSVENSSIRDANVIWLDYDDTFVAGSSYDSKPSYYDMVHREHLLVNVEFIHKIMERCRLINPQIKFGILTRREAYLIRDVIDLYNADSPENPILLDYIAGGGNERHSALAGNEPLYEVYNIMKFNKSIWNHLKKQKSKRGGLWALLKGCVVLSCRRGILLDDKEENVEIYREGEIFYTTTHAGIFLEKPKTLREFWYLIEKINKNGNNAISNNHFAGENIGKMRNIIRNSQISADTRTQTRNTINGTGPRQVVMSYNVFWEAVNRTKLLERCQGNICVDGIANIIIENALSNKCDFIFLQEVRITSEDEWTNLEEAIRRANPHFFDTYGISGSDKPNKWANENYFAGNMILYDKEKYALAADEQGKPEIYCMNIGDHNHDYRPVVFTMFEERSSGRRIICVNVHFPHKKLREAYEIIHIVVENLQKLEKNRGAQVILAGDFNHNPTIEDVRIMLNSENTKDYRPSNIKTCCDWKYGNIHVEKLRFWGDHIFSSIGKLKYFVPNVLQYNFIGSDHVPIISVISLPVPNKRVSRYHSPRTSSKKKSRTRTRTHRP